MKIIISETANELGKKAAKQAALIINNAIESKGNARIALSTGASQFTFFSAFVKEDIDWGRVEMFHLDEYIGVDSSHPASFCKYLKERFISLLPKSLKAAYLIDGRKDAKSVIKEISEEILIAPPDLGMIGIGENAHIAFNDPPADFITGEPYIVVNLSDTCKAQQVREGWFENAGKVCKQAVSMSCRQIMKCKHIISAVPYAVKNNAVKAMLKAEKTDNNIPATLLKTHPGFWLYLDKESGKGVTV